MLLVIYLLRWNEPDVDLLQNVGREICWRAPVRLYNIIKVDLMEMNVGWVMVGSGWNWLRIVSVEAPNDIRRLSYSIAYQKSSSHGWVLYTMFLRFFTGISAYCPGETIATPTCSVPLEEEILVLVIYLCFVFWMCT